MPDDFSWRGTLSPAPAVLLRPPVGEGILPKAPET